MPGTAIPALDLAVSLDDALADLTAAYEVAGRSPHTIAIFDIHIKHLIRFLAEDGVTTVDRVSTAHVTRFLAHERKRGLRPASLSAALRTIRASSTGSAPKRAPEP